MYASFPLLSRNLLSPRGGKTYFHCLTSSFNLPTGCQKNIAVTVANATQTPHFSSLMGGADRGLWRKRAQSFSRSLHPDFDLFEMGCRNSVGAAGLIGTATLEI